MEEKTTALNLKEAELLAAKDALQKKEEALQDCQNEKEKLQEIIKSRDEEIIFLQNEILNLQQNNEMLKKRHNDSEKDAPQQG